MCSRRRFQTNRLKYPLRLQCKPTTTAANDSEQHRIKTMPINANRSIMQKVWLIHGSMKNKNSAIVRFAFWYFALNGIVSIRWCALLCSNPVPTSADATLYTTYLQSNGLETAEYLILLRRFSFFLWHRHFSRCEYTRIGTATKDEVKQIYWEMCIRCHWQRRSRTEI